jgi:hypothetical protein
MVDVAQRRLDPIEERLDGEDRRRLVELMTTVDRALEPPLRPIWWLE